MLRLENVRTYYGDSLILHGISLEVPDNKCVALLGRNGVGKTTTLRTILGLTPSREGAIWFDNTQIAGLLTHKIVALGIAYVPENRGIFSSLTVEEHLTLAQSVARRQNKARDIQTAKPNGTASAQGGLDYLYELFPNIAQRRRNYGNQLSGGEQQMLAIARALVLEPKLLLLDEPSEGLAPIIIEELEKCLRRIKQAGTTILLVEQNYALATSLADQVHVMSQGQIQFSGTTAQLESNNQVKQLHLGI
jgi:branched-chain amino acid transport system ATP-binding protein